MSNMELFDAFSKKAENKASRKRSTSKSIISKETEKAQKTDEIEVEVEFEPADATVEELAEETIKFYKETVVDVIENASCVHKVVRPKDLLVPHSHGGFRLLKTEEYTKKYAFELDAFQQHSISCIHNNESVLVSAHTSAGKTVMAQYAIATSLKNQQRVIYTSPIKALSNQKYRELSEEFKDVGLQTGDVTINPGASCLVMTTEILRSMLYRGSELMREIGWVIFDEIHYMRDVQRGVIWEETIIMLPDNVRYVFLSATIPNDIQFAEWIALTKKQPVNVVSTDFRPTPLQHYFFPVNSDSLFMVLDQNSQFKKDCFERAMSFLDEKAQPPQAGAQRAEQNKNKNSLTTNINKLIALGMRNNFAPMIIFSFSKKECEFYALNSAKMDFNTKEEKKSIEFVFNNAIDCLSDDDKKLPQVENMLPLLKRGIGIHHSGLLPILKELTEILFGEGLIKVLFATETFAMGLNMPARTVIFTSCFKFDGKERRCLTSGEYIQMSGRAGRRGLDQRGIVIVMVDSKLDSNTGRDLVTGKADPLKSAFRLTYNMLLNLIRLDGITPEFIIYNSFFQHQVTSSIPEKIQHLRDLQVTYDSIVFNENSKGGTNIDELINYVKIKEQLSRIDKDIQYYVTKPVYLMPFITPGRLVKIDSFDPVNYGVIVNSQKIKQKNEMQENYQVVVEVLVKCVKRNDENKARPEAYLTKLNELYEYIVVPFSLSAITTVSPIKLMLGNDVRPLSTRMQIADTIESILKEFDEIPTLDPVKDMKVKDEEFMRLKRQKDMILKKLKSSEVHKNYESLDASLKELVHKKISLSEQLKYEKEEIRRIKSVVQLSELKCRKRVLRRLGFITPHDVIELKGRVACEISSSDELLLTEMMFNGAFNELTAHQVAALLSCFVFEERPSNNASEQALVEELKNPLKVLREAAAKICEVSDEAQFYVDSKQYIAGFVSSLMDVVYSWAKGTPFAQICKMTPVFEGSIVRTIRRLEELLRQMTLSARVIGNADLEKKFTEASTLIKRDIVFAASLYL